MQGSGVEHTVSTCVTSMAWEMQGGGTGKGGVYPDILASHSHPVARQTSVY